MAKGLGIDPKGRSRKERFITLPHYIVKSDAYRKLPNNAKALLTEVWVRYNGSNNGDISYSVREAIVIGLGRSVAARMFNVLVEQGFLVPTRNSAFSVKTRAARTWRLTMEPCNGAPATKEFMREKGGDRQRGSQI